ncbi:hypothetical protein VCR31J2_110044 [Vibrio coralliirubri]|uniref:Uncharacterized protein n=1 Tax=Vibrio coralliirubri TaxID=1516159 RepID=A0AA87C062_9VIBR|nr:hypothetical protein VCR31J2_110044 [Vibrio coralliirubri]
MFRHSLKRRRSVKGNLVWIVLLLEIPNTSFLSSGMTISNCVSSFPKAAKERNRESRLDSIAIRDSKYFVAQFWNDDF